MTKTTSNLIWNIVETTALMLGPALLILHISSFRTSKGGFYYESTNEWGMAVGAMLISLIFVAKIWRK